MQLHLCIIHRPAAGAQRAAVARHRLRHPEQRQRLIEQMRAEVVPNTRADAGILAPAVAHFGAEAVPARLKKAQRTQLAARQERLQRQKITVPAAVMKDRKQPPGAFCPRHQLAPLGDRVHHRLFQHDVPPGGEALRSEGKMHRIRRGNDDQLRIGLRQHRRRIGELRHGNIRLRAAAHQRGEAEIGARGNQRQMKGAGGHTTANDRDGNVLHGILLIKHDEIL